LPWKTVRGMDCGHLAGQAAGVPSPYSAASGALPAGTIAERAQTLSLSCAPGRAARRTSGAALPAGRRKPETAEVARETEGMSAGLAAGVGSWPVSDNPV
jgi:hypothetical protein